MFFTSLYSRKVSCKKIAFNNIVFHYSQLGYDKAYNEYYERALEEFLDISIAKAVLRLLDTMLNKK